MRFKDSIRVIEYNDKVAIMDVSDTTDYVLLTCEKYSDILTMLEDDYKGTYPDILKKMIACGWFDHSDSSMEKLSTNSIPHVVLELTEKCNAFCSHCYYNAKSANEGPEISVREYNKFVKPFLNYVNAKYIALTGGEPTLAESMEYILKDNIMNTQRTVILYTNGLSLSDSTISILKEYNERIGMQVSLDGATAETNDRSRGKGVFKKVIDTLDRLKKQDIRRVSVKMTITPDNVHEYPDFSKMIMDYGFTPSVSTYKRIGRGEEGYSYEDVLQIMEKSLRSMIPDFRAMSPCDDKHFLFSEMSCGLGRKKSCVISPQLMLLDCTSMRRVQGSIRENPTEAVKAYMDLYFPTVDELPQCKSCEVRYACGGGCRSIAYSLGCEVLDEQPYCQMYRNQYREMIWKEKSYCVRDR